MEWFPDWSREKVLIAASGPSQRQEDIERFRGTHKVVVINDTYRLAPWADVLYACDLKWWENKGPTPDEFTGMRVIGIDEYPGCHTIHVNRSKAISFRGNELGSGGNSGCQALNLVALWGAREIVLLGYDYKNVPRHWFGLHPSNLHKPKPTIANWWNASINKASEVLSRKGVSVVNCTRDTSITCFPRMSVDEYLEGKVL